MRMRKAFWYSATMVAGIGSTGILGCGSNEPEPSPEPDPVQQVEDDDNRFNVDAEAPSTARPGFEIGNLPGSIAGSVEDAFDGKDEAGEDTSSSRMFGAMSRALYRGLTSPESGESEDGNAPETNVPDASDTPEVTEPANAESTDTESEE